MDAAPTTFANLPVDAELGLPVPFACGTDDPYGAPAVGPSARHLDKRRVTQCALSRICGVCGAGLGRPIAFLGTEREVRRNSFHFPPTHRECAESLVREYAGATGPVLGQDPAPAGWVVVTTSSFEFVRPAREDTDRRPTFEPHALLG